jgi:tetratricopeptide (TPR) repeat protein
VQRAVDRQGITFLGTDIDRNGGKIILAAGTPVATGNDEERMLLALREIMDCEYEIPIRIGVNRGPVFAGEVGPPYRRTYTVMGDAVNLAARVMAKAQPGQILATSSVLEPSRTQFETEELEPFHVKGKSLPVQAFAVGAVARAKKSEGDGIRTPLIGREKEMEVLQAALDSARRGEGRLVEIVGEPGIGKSRLIEELRDRAADMASLTIACELYESSTPYFAFQDLLHDLMGIDAGAPDEQAAQRLLDVLRESDPLLLPWAPLLALALEIEMPPTPETDALEDRFRRPRLEEVAITLLRRLLPNPTLITVEDTHWMDEASSDLLRRIVQVVPDTPWLICATRRDVDEGFAAPEAPHVASMRPAPLAPEAAAALVDAVTGDTPLAPHEIAALSERSGGNPLFLKELLAAARAAGGIEGLPDSVEALITARIDRLPPVERNLLRQLSVLGQTFARNIADAVLPAGFPSDDDRTWDHLGEFLSKDSPGSVSFRHALIRDAAYEGLPFRLRRDLHARIGETIEKEAGDQPDDEAELLSFHFFHSQRYPDAWRYSLVAAERAKTMYANVEAADFYQRALEAARRVEDLGNVELARIHEALGDVRSRMGLYREAGLAYRAVRRLQAGDRIVNARLILKLSQVQSWLGRFSLALAWITRGLRTLEGVHGSEAAMQRAQLLVWYAQFCEEQSRHPDAIRWCRRAIGEAEAVSEKDALARAYKILDLAHVDMGQPDLAIYSHRALQLYEELGDLSGQGAVLDNMGSFAYWRGQWDEALRLWQHANEIWNRTGDPVNTYFSSNNIAEIYSDQGRFEEAEKLFRETYRVWQAAGYKYGVAYVKSNMARLAARAGRFDEAVRLFHEAGAESREVGATGDVLDNDARLAECHTLQGSWTDALAIAHSGLEQARAVGGVPAAVASLHRACGYVLLSDGDVAGARSAFEQSLNAARVRKDDYEAALTLRGLARVARLEGDGHFHDLEAESRAILARLGVVSAPEPPVGEMAGVSVES